VPCEKIIGANRAKKKIRNKTLCLNQKIAGLLTAMRELPREQREAQEKVLAPPSSPPVWLWTEKRVQIKVAQSSSLLAATIR
jgi:hypothetical protein